MPATDPYKPDGYTSLSPYCVVEGAETFIAHLREVFGAVPLRRFDLPDGGILHAEVRIDDSVVMLGDSGPDHPPTSNLLHLYVPDVDAVFERARAAGCTAIEAPVRKAGEPDRRGSFRDKAGNVWSVATMVGDRPDDRGSRRDLRSQPDQP